MSFARNVEHLLESMVDRVAGAVFSGAMSPAEIGGRVIRAVDLATSAGPLGTEVPNAVEVHINPSDLGDGPGERVLGAALGAALEDEAAQRGWRTNGPCVVRVLADDDVPRNRPTIRTDSRPGPRPPWGRLVTTGTEHLLTDNRLLVGRSDAADVQLMHESVSRSHGLIWRQAGELRVRDLGSANGTAVNGRRVTGDTTLADGDEIAFGDVAARMSVA